MRECCDASEGNPLILIALVGGGFKVFGTEVSGKTGHPVLRIVAGVMGLFLLIFGLVGTSDFTSINPGAIGHRGPLVFPLKLPAMRNRHHRLEKRLWKSLTHVTAGNPEHLTSVSL